MLPAVFEREFFREPGLLFGWNLGARLSSFTAPPWLGAPERDGEVAGRLEAPNHNDIRVTFSVGRLVRVEACFDLTHDEEKDAVAYLGGYAADIAARLADRGLKATLKNKQGRFELKCAVPGDVPGALSLVAQTIDTGGDPIYRVQLRLVAEDEDAVEPDEGSAFISASELAAVTATRQHSRAECEDVFNRFFKYASAYDASQSPEAPLVKAIYSALQKLEPRELKLRTHALLRLVDYTQRNCDDDLVTHSLSGTGVDDGGWLKLPPAARLFTVQAVAESMTREALVAAALRVSDALDFDEATAFEQLHAALAAHPNHDTAWSNIKRLEWFPPSHLGDQLFSLATAGKTLADVARFTIYANLDDRAPHAVMQLKATQGSTAANDDFAVARITDTLGARANPNTAGKDVMAARFFALVRGFDEALFAELASEPLTLREGLCVLLADEREVTLKPPRGIYRLGARLVVYATTRGRFVGKVTDYSDTDAAVRAFGRLVGPKARSPKKTPSTRRR